MKTATIENQITLEETYSKFQLMPVLRDQFKELVEDIEDKDWAKFLVESLVQIYLHRQADVPTMVGVLSPKFGTPQEVADKLLLAAEFDFIDFDPDREVFKVIYDVTDDVVAQLEKYQYPLPMVIRPAEVTDNTSTGYSTIKNPVVLNGSPYFKGKDMCLDHLNRANSVALTFDEDTINSQQGVFTVPKRKPGEDFEEFRKRQRQAAIFYDTSISVMAEIAELTDQFWLTHRYDRRGRCYASGYHVNTQGTPYNKAVLQLANKEVCT